MSSSTPFYQQLRVSFSAIFLIVTFALAAISALFYWQAQQLAKVLEQDLPKVLQTNSYHQAIVDTENILARLTLSQSAVELQQHYHALHKQLFVISKYPSVNSKTFDRALELQKTQTSLIARLASNENRNDLLRESALIQLHLVLDELSASQSTLKEQQDKLYQQLAKDKVRDRVTTARLTAYLGLAQQSDNLMLTRIAVEQMIELFDRVSLTYPLTDFDHISQQLVDALALWQGQFEQIEQASELEKQRLANLIALHQLLYTKQSTIAKWRGHIRVAQEFVLSLEPLAQLLAKQRHDTRLFEPSKNTETHALTSYLPTNIKLSKQQFLWSLLALLLAIFLLFVALLANLRRRIKCYDESNKSLVEQQLAGNEQIAPDSLFQQQLIELLDQLTKPKHSEQDFVALEERVRDGEKLLFEQAGVLLLNSDTELTAQCQDLLLAETAAKKSWRHAFAKADTLKLLELARRAKTSGEIQRLAVQTLAGQPLNISVSVNNDKYFITIAKSDIEQQLTQEVERLEQELIRLDKDQQLQLACYSEQLSQMLIRAMLQNQSISIGSGESSLQIARQLQRMYDWCEQFDVAGQKQESLNDALVPAELLSEMLNVAWYASWQRNKVIFIQDPLLLSCGQLKLTAFHQLIARIAKLCLQDKFNVTLLIEAALVDKNAGQQIVRLTFEMRSRQVACLLPESLKQLVDLTPKLQNNDLLAQFLQALVQINHVANVQVSEAEGKCAVSLDFSIALAQQQLSVASEVVNLKEQSFVVFGSDPILTQQLKQVITKANARVEDIESLEHLTKLLTSKHLNSHPIAALVVTPEQAQQSYVDIIQHLNTLAKPLRPKVLVLQAQYYAKLHQLGLFEHSEFDARNENFSEKLQSFIQSEQENNLLISAEVFKQHQLSQSQIEVLLATEHPESMLVFARILHWLGLQVHLVSHQHTLLSQWQSGRYLLLFNQLEVNPVVEMAVGKKVNRGIFTLPIKDQVRQPVERLPEHWQSSIIENILDIDGLVKLLSPWLKMTYREAKIVDKALVINDKQSQQQVKAQVTSHKANAHSKMQNEAFDLTLYVQHQGSLELAVFMLDDYIEDIHQAINALEQSVVKQECKQAKLDNAQLQKLARILAAPELLALSEQVTQALAREAFNELPILLAALKETRMRLAEFAQAI